MRSQVGVADRLLNILVNMLNERYESLGSTTRCEAHAHMSDAQSQWLATTLGFVGRCSVITTGLVYTT